MLIGQKSITWQMVFCPTTGDDVSRSLFDWADRSLFTRTRPIDSVLQVWLTRAESASAQLQLASCRLRAFLNPTSTELSWAFNSSKSRKKNAAEFVKLHALIRITIYKTSLLQIVINLFLLLFHRVYFSFCWLFQLNLSFKTLFAIRFWPCYQSSVFCMYWSI